MIDAAAWATLAKGLAAPIGVVQLLDEQMNNHFSGTQRSVIIDADVNQETFDPIVTTISDVVCLVCSCVFCSCSVAMSFFCSS